MTRRWLGGLMIVLLFVSVFMLLSRWQFNASSNSLVHNDPAKDTLRPYTEVLQAGEPITTYTVDTVAQAEGRYVAGSSYLIANRYDNGEEGYWVITEFIPDGADMVSTETSDSQPRALAVARAWTPTPVVPEEPGGTVKIAGRIIANDGPVPSNMLDAEDRQNPRILGSAATAQLTNLWDSPLYGGIFTVRAETTAPQEIPTTAENTIDPAATILGQSENLKPINAEQILNTQHNWLNIFYAAEWIIFAFFAIYLWLHMLRDAVYKEKNPTHYYEYTGEYFLDEETGRYYYYDEEDNQYYFFDEQPSTTR